MVKEKLSLSYDSRTSEYVAVHMRMDLVAFRSCVNSHSGNRGNHQVKAEMQRVFLFH